MSRPPIRLLTTARRLQGFLGGSDLNLNDTLRLASIWCVWLLMTPSLQPWH